MNKIKTVFSNKSGEIVGKIEESLGEYEAYIYIPPGYEYANTYFKIGAYNSFEIAKTTLDNYFNNKENISYDIKYLLLLFSVFALMIFLGLYRFI